MSLAKSKQEVTASSLRSSIMIDASAERLFDLWTTPAHIQRWWGPEGVECPYAEVDLRVGGEYRIANRMQDGSTIWITGQFETISRPSKLVYSWQTSNRPGERASESTAKERVTVSFTAHEDKTEVTVLHEFVSDEETLRSHELGWTGCLSGLEGYAQQV